MEKTYETLGGWRKFYIGYLWFGAIIAAGFWSLAIFGAIENASPETGLFALGLIALYAGLIYGSQKAIIQRKTGMIMLCSLGFLLIAPLHTLFHWLAAAATQRENKAEKEKAEQMDANPQTAILAS